MLHLCYENAMLFRMRECNIWSATYNKLLICHFVYRGGASHLLAIIRAALNQRHYLNCIPAWEVKLVPHLLLNFTWCHHVPESTMLSRGCWSFVLLESQANQPSPVGITSLHIPSHHIFLCDCWVNLQTKMLQSKWYVKPFKIYPNKCSSSEQGVTCVGPPPYPSENPQTLTRPRRMQIQINS